MGRSQRRAIPKAKRLATAPDIPTVDEASMSARLIILLVGARYRRKSRISVSKNNED